MSVGLSPGQDADGWWLDAVPDLEPQVDDGQNPAVGVPADVPVSDAGGGDVSDVAVADFSGFTSGFAGFSGAGNEHGDSVGDCRCRLCVAVVVAAAAVAP